jgi:hypothetical protein
MATNEVRIGVNSFGELVITWVCPSCKQNIMCRVPLERIIQDIPAPPSGEPLTKEDLKWMAKMHITTD